MAIRIELGSYLRRFASGYDPDRGLELEYSPDKTVGQVISELGIPAKEVGVITINGNPARFEQLLSDGDLVGLFAVALGG